MKHVHQWILSSKLDISGDDKKSERPGGDGCATSGCVIEYAEGKSRQVKLRQVKSRSVKVSQCKSK